MLDAATLLAVWEEAETQPPIHQALSILAAAFPAMAREQWARVALGRRDWYLLYVRQQLFGEQLDAVASCPACGEKLETGFTVNQICPPGWELVNVPGHWREHGPGAAAGAAMTDGPRRKVSLATGEYVVRAPSSADLLEGLLEGQGATRHLMLRCLESADALQPALAPMLDDTAQQSLSECLQELDPLAEIRIDLQCPACRHAWTLDFDIVRWLWSEIGDWAVRLLQQVHALAQTYGWSEASILAMPAKRRRRYLDMLGYT